MKNYGIKRENDIIDALNNKRFYELNPNLKLFVNFLFKNNKADSIVQCERMYGYPKPDFKITTNNKTRYVSMKSGATKCIHSETIQNFISYLRNEGITDETLKTILLYQFGDLTLDGSGKERYSLNEILKPLKERIEKANKELNSNLGFILKFTDRCFFTGLKHTTTPADTVYYGTYEKGVAVTNIQIFNYVLHKNWNFYTLLHIGPFLLRPGARYAHKEILQPRRRFIIYAEWPKFYEKINDIIKYSHNKSIA